MALKVRCTEHNHSVDREMRRKMQQLFLFTALLLSLADANW